MWIPVTGFDSFTKFEINLRFQDIVVWLMCENKERLLMYVELIWSSEYNAQECT